jgi:hypothetical protein
MAKIRAPISFSNAFSIEKSILETLGIFNPIINVDTPLFIDPTLLKYSTYDSFNKEAISRINQYLSELLKLVKSSTIQNDACWRQAKRLLAKKEIQGTCLGYGVNSISGRSISNKVQEQILLTCKEIINKGIEDPDLFFLLPLFEEGIGPDTISDITVMIIEEILLDFTESISKKIEVPVTSVVYKGHKRNIIKNPIINKKMLPVILMPNDILRDLPMVSSWDEIPEAASFNQTLRQKVNRTLGKLFHAHTKKEKDKERLKIFNDVDSLKLLIEVIKTGKVKPYDMENDPQGLIAWQKLLNTITFEKDISKKSKVESFENLDTFVREIIEQFKFLIEEKGLNKSLWNKKTPNHERTSQLLFFATAYSYCKAYDIDLNPEMDAGIGYVDFKFSKGFTKRVVVEIKHSYNPNIENGFNIQLSGYKKSEETAFGYYVIVDVGGLGKKLDKVYAALNHDVKKKADIFYINARIKPSASKRKT